MHTVSELNVSTSCSIVNPLCVCSMYTVHTHPLCTLTNGNPSNEKKREKFGLLPNWAVGGGGGVGGTII